MFLIVLLWKLTAGTFVGIHADKECIPISCGLALPVCVFHTVQLTSKFTKNVSNTICALKNLKIIHVLGLCDMRSTLLGSDC